MKREITEWICDRCGAKMDERPDDGYMVGDEFSFIGIKAMYSNCGVGSKYDLCLKCTLELAKQFIEKMEKGE